MQDIRPRLTPEQRTALEAYARTYAKAEDGWKERLCQQWATGGDTQEAHGAELRQIRNTYGPTWLMDEYAAMWQPNCPVWEPATYKDGLPVKGSGAPVWTGKGNPPCIGDTVTTKVNKLGSGVVTGYFVEEDFLGLVVCLNDAPEWHVKQRKGDPVIHLFGAELAEPAEPHPEAVVTNTNGAELRTAAYPLDVDYIRVVNAAGQETGYWTMDEVAEDPALVIGAIMGAMISGKMPGA